METDPGPRIEVLATPVLWRGMDAALFVHEARLVMSQASSRLDDGGDFLAVTSLVAI